MSARLLRTLKLSWAGNDDDEGYEFAQQAKDSSDDDTLQNASYEVMSKTKTRAPLFFNLVLRPGAAHDIYTRLVFLEMEFPPELSLNFPQLSY